MKVGRVNSKQVKKVCKVTGVQCYHCFILYFLLATAKWLPAEQQLHGSVVNSCKNLDWANMQLD